MIPADFNLALYRGDTGRWQFKLWADANKTQPVDLTGVSVEAMIRDTLPTGRVAMQMDCTITVPNIIDMVLTSLESTNLPAKGFWDLQLTYPSGDVVTPLKGTVLVTQDVTHADAAKRLAMVK
jgi:hypothetical protein